MGKHHRDPIGENMRNLRFCYMFLLISVYLLILFSCNFSDRVSTSTVAPILESTSTRVSVKTSTGTNPIAKTASYTTNPVPTVAGTPTRSPTPKILQPSWTPLPTLPIDDAIYYIDNLLENNDSYRLPCWWGIMPGKTPWHEASHFLSQFTQVIAQVSPQDKSVLVAFVVLTVSQRISARNLTHTYIVNDGTVETIEINPGETDAYKLLNFLNSYGVPDQVWISTYRNFYINEGIESLPFIVVLFYPSQGIMAVYASGEVSISNNQVLGCYSDNITSLLGLWAPENAMSFAEASKRFRMDAYDLFLPLEEATNMTIEAFYNTFKTSSHSACIKTSTNLWPEQ